jgi:lysophospholipase L1-like esterase
MFKYFGVLICGCIMAWLPVAAQYDSSFRFYYYDQKLSLFEKMPTTPQATIWLGDSITDGAEWNELFPGTNAINRGISSDVTFGVLHRLPEIVRWQPKRIFVLIGINDVARGIPDTVIISNMLQIINGIKNSCPNTQLIIQSILPTNNTFSDFPKYQNKLSKIKHINHRLQQLCKATGTFWLDLYPSFCDGQGKLDAKYTNDGLHLTGNGYLKWKEVILQLKLL